MTIALGKIQQCEIQFHDKIYALEVWFELGGQGWGVDDRWQLSTHVILLDELMRATKVTNIKQLVGKPIEATLDGNLLKSWRILTEVL